MAHAGDPAGLVFWRSAAKPFQLWPLIRDGGVARFQLDDRMMALACGSHNAEPIHRETTERWLNAIGFPESALACGGHPSLSPRIARAMIRNEVIPTPVWSNCSGKHAAMLALARLHDLPADGYQQLGHPVQGMIADSISQWSGLNLAELHWGVDGCTAAAVATPLIAMARAWAGLGSSTDPAMKTIREAMIEAPEMVAGPDRLDTMLMQAWPGRVVVKVGAEGVYGAALPASGLGLALKVADGDTKSAGIALLYLLRQLTGRLTNENPFASGFEEWVDPVIRNTRGEPVGGLTVSGELSFDIVETANE
jgi:L-asparaginase II